MAGGETRPKILQAGHELMLARGYSATSVDEICSTGGVSKGSFYHFFASKEELGLAVLNRFYQEGVRLVGNGDFLSVTDPRERLEAFFDHLEAVAPEFWQRGCLLGNFATELAESNPVIHARVTELFDDLVERLAPLFGAVIGDAKEASSLAEEMLMVLEGSIILARVHDDPQRIADGVRHFRRALEARLAMAESTAEAG
jgi:TetR/AcrR family transcriptional repressor of nem operon